jgi:hypothetical protein
MRRKNLLFALAVTHAAVGTAALFGSGFYSDRYSLDSAWSIGIALILVVPWEKRAARITSIIVLAAVAIFGVLSTREYFAWQRARWTAYASLRASGAAVTDIDGGSETTNLYEIATMNRDDARRRTLYRPARTYMITFGPMPGHVVVARYPFTGWLGMHRGAIYVVKRQ